MIAAMSRVVRRLGFAAAFVLAASCGGQSFSVGGDAGILDGSVVTTDTASDALSSDDDATDGGSMALDAAPSDAFVPDVVEEPPPHCGGAFGCVPSVPTGWSGPFELYSGSAASPACSTNFEGPAYNGNGQLAAPPAVCKCSCDGPTGVSCSAPAISFYGEPELSDGCTPEDLCTEVSLQSGVCTEVDAIDMCPFGSETSGMTVGAPAPSGGTCAGLPVKTIAPYTWGVSARACVSSLAPDRADCAAGSICAPQTASPYGSGLCISEPGAVACPATGYTTAMTFYGNATDARGCTTCSCGAVTGAACSGTVNAYNSTNGTCTGLPDSYIAPFSCDTVQQPADIRFTVTASGGSCTASPVTATGAAVPATPTTFCCLP